MLQLPRVGWRLLACENGQSPDCTIVVLDAGIETRCVHPQVIELIGKLLVPSHQRVRLPATPAPLTTHRKNCVLKDSKKIAEKSKK